MTKEEIEEISKAVEKAQGASYEEAWSSVMEFRDADSDIAAAALQWARTGVMPDRPLIEDWTPKSLDKHLYPSQTFGILNAFRVDKELGLELLSSCPGRDDTEDVIY